MQRTEKHRTDRESPKILIIDDLHESILELGDFFNVDYKPYLSPEQALHEIPKYEILILRSKLNITEEMMSAWPQLKIIGRAGAGMDNLDVEAAEKLGIELLNCGEGNRMAVAEHTLGLLLGLTSRIVKSHQEVSRMIWDREGNRGIEVGERTVGLIGFGNTGSAVGQLLQGFPGRVLAYDKYKPNYTKNYDHVEAVDLETIQKEADMISFHVPLTDETRGWINRDFISACKKPCYLLNLSRGGIMDLNDILTGLRDEKLLGFATDVLPNERPETWSDDERKLITELATDERVIMTPHVGGWTHESYRKISEILGAKIRSRWKEVSARNLK
jgi:D-3-phosphoglycerate dehydrogenase